MSYKTLRLYLQHGQGRPDTAELPKPERLKSRLPRRFYLAWRQKLCLHLTWENTYKDLTYLHTYMTQMQFFYQENITKS